MYNDTDIQKTEPLSTEVLGRLRVCIDLYNDYCKNGEYPINSQFYELLDALHNAINARARALDEMRKAVARARQLMGIQGDDARSLVHTIVLPNLQLDAVILEANRLLTGGIIA